MKSPRTTPFLLLLAALAFGAGGCTIAATPNLSAVGPGVSTTHVVAYEAPPRVYHSGRWLYYRNDGYYYRTGSSWVVASSVPTHVVRYHRPVHYSRPVHYRTSRPAPVHYSRPGYSRPTHVRSSTPTHVGRTVTNRRTYYRR